MTRHIASSGSSFWADTSVDELATDILGPLVTLLRKSGLDAASVTRIVETQNAEVDRQVETGASTLILGRALGDMGELLFRWHRRTEYLDRHGLPAAIAGTGSAPSIEALCAELGRPYEHGEAIDLLLKFRGIERVSENLYRPLTATFLSASSDGRTVALDAALKQVAAFVATVEHNVMRGQSSDRAWFERSCGVVLPEEYVPVAAELVNQRGQDFIDSIDEWLSRQSGRSSKHGRYVEVGAGGYFRVVGPIMRNKDP